MYYLLDNVEKVKERCLNRRVPNGTHGGGATGKSSDKEYGMRKPSRHLFGVTLSGHAYLATDRCEAPETRGEAGRPGPAIPGWSGKANTSESSQGSSDVRCENRNGIRKNRRTNQNGTAWVAYLTTICDGQT